MNTKEPPKTKTILATPINVEESRAQRQQRSQARFRDRGGIFVPSNRNTLADILLGKASPLKKAQRGVTESPSLNRQGKGTANGLRRKSNASVRKSSESPLKQNRKLSQGVPQGLVAAPDSDCTTLKMALVSSKESKDKPLSKTVSAVSKAEISAKKLSTRAPKGAKPVGLKIHGAPDGHDPLPKAKGKTKAKVVKKKAIIQEDTDDHEPLPKTKAKAKTKSKAARKKVVHEEAEDQVDSAPKSILKTNGVRKDGTSHSKPSKHLGSKEGQKSSNSETPSAIATSSTITEPAVSKRSKPRKSGDLYSCGESEDEYMPKVPKRKSAASGVKSKISSGDGSKPSTSAKKAAIASAKQPKRASDALSDIMEEEEEEETPAPVVKSSQSQNNGTSSKSETTTQPASSKSKKRIAQEAGLLDEPPQHATKRAKANGKETSSSGRRDSKPKATLTSKTSNKRTRPQDDDDIPLEEVTKKPTKRKKVLADSAPDISGLQNDVDTKEEGKATKGKPRAKSNNGKKSTSKPRTQTASRKENNARPAESEPQVKRGPPKSVLERIKASSLPQVVDNEPDPIDFLS